MKPGVSHRHFVIITRSYCTGKIAACMRTRI